MIGTIAGDMGAFLNRILRKPSVRFEVRNIRTGELMVQDEPFLDGTLADRAARELGRNWAVFRQEARADEQAPNPVQFPRHEEDFIKSLAALGEAVEERQPVPAGFKREIEAGQEHR